MPRRSERLLLARALVSISTSVSRLRFLLEVIDRRILVLREKGMEGMARELEAQRRVIADALAGLEAVSERIRTMIDLGSVSGDLADIVGLVRGVRAAVKDLQPEVAASLGEALSYIEEAIEGSRG